MISFNEAVFFCIVFVISLRGFRHIRAERPGPVLVSLIAVVIYVFCMWVPATLQVQGALESKLEGASFLASPTSQELSHLSARWSVELVTVGVAEWLAWRVRVQRKSEGSQPGGLPLLSPRVDSRQTVALIMILLGVLATVFLPAPSLQERAGGGQGVPTLLRTFLIVGLAYVVYHRGFRNMLWWGVVAVGVGYLVSSNIRSPLLVVVFGFIAAEITENRFKSFRRIVLCAVLALSFALSGSYMSSWRENVTRHQGLNAGQVLEETLDNPWIEVYESGVDTLDGYRFSQQIAPIEKAQPQDILNIVLTFVPRAIWEEKPVTISVDVSSRYLNYGASGQYLSPVGWFTLAIGSYLGALLGMFVFTLVMSLLVRKFINSFVLALLLCVTFRFFLGGSSFDLYYGLTLALPYVATLLMTKLVLNKSKTSGLLASVPTDPVAMRPRNGSARRAL